MVNLNGNKVVMTKGDTVVLSISIQSDGEEYVFNEGDKVRFALKKTYSDVLPIIVKDIPTDTMVLRLDPQDTKSLPSGILHGKYVYDIELTTADGAVDTVIPRGEWVILEEVY